MEVSEVILDSDLAEKFIVLRSSGKFVAGGWQESEPESIPTWGLVCVSSPREVKIVPESDRVSEMRTFHAKFELLVTNPKGTSDMILYRGDRFRVVAVLRYGNRGYYKAIATRLKGE